LYYLFLLFENAIRRRKVELGAWTPESFGHGEEQASAEKSG
jgi:hypothetical protein